MEENLAYRCTKNTKKHLFFTKTINFLQDFKTLWRIKIVKRQRSLGFVIVYGDKGSFNVLIPVDKERAASLYEEGLL